MSDSIHKSKTKVGLKCKVLARFEDGTGRTVLIQGWLCRWRAAEEFIFGFTWVGWTALEPLLQISDSGEEEMGLKREGPAAAIKQRYDSFHFEVGRQVN